MLGLKGIYRWKLVDAESGRINDEGSIHNIVTDDFIDMRIDTRSPLQDWDFNIVLCDDTLPLPDKDYRREDVAESVLNVAASSGYGGVSDDIVNNRVYKSANFNPPVSPITITVMGIHGRSTYAADREFISFVELTTPITQQTTEYLYVEYSLYVSFQAGGLNAPDNAYVNYWNNYELISNRFLSFNLNDEDDGDGPALAITPFLPPSNVNHMARKPYYMKGSRANSSIGKISNASKWAITYDYDISTTAYQGPLGSITYFGSGNGYNYYPVLAYSPVTLTPSFSRVFVHPSDRWDQIFSDPSYPPQSRAAISLSGTPTNRYPYIAKILITKTGDASDIDTDSYNGTSGNDYLTMGSSDWAIDDKISLDGSAPSPLVPSTEYYVVNKPASDQIKVSATEGGSVITLTGSGSGTATRETTGRYKLVLKPWLSKNDDPWIVDFMHIRNMELGQDIDGNVLDEYYDFETSNPVRGTFKVGDYIYSVQDTGNYLNIGRWYYPTVETSQPVVKFGTSGASYRGLAIGKGTYGGHIYIATDEGVYDYDTATPTTAPSLMSISGIIDANINDIAYDETTEMLWTGHDTGLSRINLGTNTAVTATVAGGELSGLNTDEARVLSGQITVDDDYVCKGGMSPQSTASGTRNCWLYKHGTGWVWVRDNTDVAGACLRRGTTEVVLCASFSSLTWYRYNVSIPGGSTLIESFSTTSNADDYDGSISQVAQIDDDHFMFCYNGYYGNWISRYKVGVGRQDHSTSLLPSDANDYVSIGNFNQSRHLIDMGDGVLCVSIKSFLVEAVYLEQIFGWTGSTWALNNANDRPIPKTATHSLLSGVMVDFNNSVGDPWDKQYVVDERFVFSHALMPIKDNLQEYNVKSRYYYCRAGTVQGASVVPGAIVYEAPITSDPDFRDIDTHELVTSVLDGSTPYTFYTLPAYESYTADAGTDEFTVGRNIPTGTPILFSNSDGDAPSPLEESKFYFAINVDATTIKVALTYADAVANTPIDITDAGTGTPRFLTAEPASGEYYIRSDQGFFVFNSADIAKTLTLTYNYTLF